MPAPEAGTGNGSDGNGRVTLAVLGFKMDDMADDIKELVKSSKEDHDKITVLCTKQERLDTWLKAMVAAVVSSLGAAIWSLFKQ